MDSGNSGSLQSSSNAEEEYDSQPEKTSPDFSNNQLHFSSPSNPPLHFFSPQPNNIFHLPSNYSQEMSIPDPSSLHFSDPRSEPKSTFARGIAGHSRTGTTSLQPRTSKKRTRASRRAPTTVLTTDTSNFRAMVQEFTGVTSSPFSSSTSYSRRVDLFGASPFLPFRPTPQKVQLPPFPCSSSPSASLPLWSTNMITVDNSNVQISNSSSNINSSTNFYALPSDNTVNTQGSVLSFQPCTRTAKSEESNFGRIPVLDELGLSHYGVSYHPPLTHGQSFREEPGLSGERQPESLRFLEGNAGSSSSSLQMITNNRKLKFSPSSSEFHHEKGLESIVVSSRGEVRVDSWICPSD